MKIIYTTDPVFKRNILRKTKEGSNNLIKLEEIESISTDWHKSTFKAIKKTLQGTLPRLT